MIKKLRVKFVTVAMISVGMVLLLIMGTINILSYNRVVEYADMVLEILQENDGRFPMEKDKEKGKEIPKDHMMELPELSPEMPYESRFFSVVLDESGDVLSIDTGMIAAIDRDTACEYALKVWESGKTQGFVGDYRYTIKRADNGVQIVFLDCTRNISNFHTFLLISVLVSVLGMIAVFILLVLLSDRIVRPFAESYEKQKRFITDAGHEIKTPLTIIDADAAVLEMECGESEWLQDIQKQTIRLRGLTDDLIYLSRMEENQNDQPMIDFPLSDIVMETAQSFQALAVTQEKMFACYVEPMITYHGDEKSIQRLVSILLDNALKYSKTGGKIELRLWRDGKNICLSVYNTTENVDREKLSRLFDRFYRADQSRNSETGGYGIGLSIARAIVTAHKGKIAAVTEDGKSLRINVIF